MIFKSLCKSLNPHHRLPLSDTGCISYHLLPLTRSLHPFAATMAPTLLSLPTEVKLLILSAHIESIQPYLHIKYGCFNHRTKQWQHKPTLFTKLAWVDLPETTDRSNPPTFTQLTHITYSGVPGSCRELRGILLSLIASAKPLRVELRDRGLAVPVETAKTQITASVPPVYADVVRCMVLQGFELMALNAPASAAALYITPAFSRLRSVTYENRTRRLLPYNSLCPDTGPAADGEMLEFLGEYMLPSLAQLEGLFGPCGDRELPVLETRLRFRGSRTVAVKRCNGTTRWECVAFAAVSACLRLVLFAFVLFTSCLSASNLEAV